MSHRSASQASCLRPPPSQSSFYYSASDACTSGFDDIKATVWSGDLSTATATFAGGNACKISSGGSTVAYFPVRRAGFGVYTPPIDIKTITRPNGSSHKFELVSSVWVNQMNPALTLIASGSNWVFTDANDTEEAYDSTGKLTSITYRNGQSETLEYDLTAAQGGDDDDQTLDKVTGPFGHAIRFDYDVTGRLESITTPDGAIDYAFDINDNLISATYPDTTVRDYVYEDTDLVNHLTGIIDENDDRFATWDYNADGQVILSEHAGSKEKVELAYNSNGTTTVTTGNGGVRSYTFTSAQGERKFESLSGDVCKTCPGGGIKDKSYDSNGYLDEVTDWNDNVTKTLRNSEGLITTLKEAYGSVDERVSTYTWHTSYRLPTQVNRPNHDLGITYDTDGNATEIEITDGTNSRTTAMTYNSDGQVLTINGPRTDVTDVTTLTYYTCTTGDECGQIATLTNALGQVTTYDGYDASGRLLQMTEPNGLETSMTYDARGNVLTVTQTPDVGSAITTTMTYDDAGQLATLTTPEGLVLTYTHSAAHYLESVTDNLGNEITYTYDAMGNLTDEQTYDPYSVLTRSMEYAYGVDDRLENITNGTVDTTLAIDLMGNLTSETDGLQNVTQYTFDALNRMGQTTDALSGVAEYDYDAHDNVTSVDAPNGATTSFVYDDLDNLTSEASPDRGLTSYTYDAAGNRLTATDARSIIATYTYDVLNRIASISYPTTAENVTYGYDVAASNGIGRLTSITDQSGTTSYTYDEFGNVATDVRVVSSATYTTSYQYDDDGDIASMTYPSGRVVDYVRNAMGQVTQVTSTKSSTSKTIVSSASYEPFGPVASLTYGNGVIFDYAHHSDYQVSDIDSSGVADKAYGFDAAGRITSNDDAIDTSRSETFQYDVLGRLTTESWPNVPTTNYGNDVLSDSPAFYWRLGDSSGTSASDASGNGYHGTYTGTLQYSQSGLVVGTDTAIRVNTKGAGFVVGPTMTGVSLTAIESWFQTDSLTDHRDIASINSSGQVQVLIYHDMNGKVAVWNGSVVLESNAAVSTNEVHYVAMWYESGPNKTYLMVDGEKQVDTYNGNLLSATDPQIVAGGYWYQNNTYSRFQGELDEVAVYDTAMTEFEFAGRGTAPPYEFAYDANGNRTSLSDAGSLTTYGYQTLSNQLATIDSSTVQHDLAGNRTADVGGVRTYSYSNSNRLNAVIDNSTTTATYVHNALGQRVKKTVGTSTTVYVYDLSGTLIAEHDGTGALIRDYVWLDGAPVAQIDQSETFSYIHFDHLATPRLATNDAQTVVWRWAGDAFGTALADEDPDGNSTSTTINLRYSGQYFDSESGFHYNYYRTYDPSTGRYLESDPIGLVAGLNTYSYVGNMPTMYVDPSGMTAEDANIIMEYILENYADIRPRGGIKYGEQNEGTLASTDPRTGDIYLPADTECRELSQDEFESLFFSVLHESMHSTDSWGTAAWDAFNQNRLGRTTGNHQAIHNREFYEQYGGSIMDPIWGLPKPKSEFRADPVDLFNQSRERGNQVSCDCN